MNTISPLLNIKLDSKYYDKQKKCIIKKINQLVFKYLNRERLETSSLPLINRAKTQTTNSQGWGSYVWGAVAGITDRGIIQSSKDSLFQLVKSYATNQVQGQIQPAIESYKHSFYLSQFQPFASLKENIQTNDRTSHQLLTEIDHLLHVDHEVAKKALIHQLILGVDLSERAKQQYTHQIVHNDILDTFNRVVSEIRRGETAALRLRLTEFLKLYRHQDKTIQAALKDLNLHDKQPIAQKLLDLLNSEASFLSNLALRSAENPILDIFSDSIIPSLIALTDKCKKEDCEPYTICDHLIKISIDSGDNKTTEILQKIRGHLINSEKDQALNLVNQLTVQAYSQVKVSIQKIVNDYRAVVAEAFISKLLEKHIENYENTQDNLREIQLYLQNGKLNDALNALNNLNSDKHIDELKLLLSQSNAEFTISLLNAALKVIPEEQVFHRMMVDTLKGEYVQLFHQKIPAKIEALKKRRTEIINKNRAFVQQLQKLHHKMTDKNEALNLHTLADTRDVLSDDSTVKRLLIHLKASFIRQRKKITQKHFKDKFFESNDPTVFFSSQETANEYQLFSSQQERLEELFLKDSLKKLENLIKLFSHESELADINNLQNQVKNQSNTMQKAIAKALNDFATKPTEDIHGILTELLKAGQEEAVTVLQERLLSPANMVANAEKILEGLINQINGDVTPMKREDLIQHQKAQIRKLKTIGDNSWRVVNEIVALAVQMIDLSFKPVEDTDQMIDLTRLLVSKESKISAKHNNCIVFAKFQNIPIAMNREDLIRVLWITIGQSILGGKSALENAAKDETGNVLTGWNFLSDLLQEGLQGMITELQLPGANYPFDDQEKTTALINKLFDPNLDTLPFTPFIKNLFSTLFIKGSVGPIPFELISKKPLLPSLFETSFDTTIYTKKLDKVIGITMKDTFESLAKRGSIYNEIFTKSSTTAQPLQLSPQETALKKQLGKLALEMLKKFQRNIYDEVIAFNHKKTFLDSVGLILLNCTKNAMLSFFKVNVADDMTMKTIYNTILGISAENIKFIRENTTTQKENEKENEKEAKKMKKAAIENLSQVVAYAEPLLSYESPFDFIVNSVGRFFNMILIQPVIWVLSEIVKGWCKFNKQDYKHTYWYSITEGRKIAKQKRLAEDLHKELREFLQNVSLWHRLYDRAIHDRVIIKA